MVHKHFSVTYIGQEGIPLWDTRTGMVFGIIIIAEEDSITVARRRLRGWLASHVFVTKSYKN